MKISRSGISLVELIVAITIAAIGGLLAMGILTSSNNVFINQTIQIEQGLSLNQSTLEITNLIKSSAGVAGQYPPAGGAQYTGSENVLVLKLPALSPSGQIIDAVFDYAVIVREPADSQILRLRLFADPLSSRKSQNKVLSTSLQNLKFTYQDSANNPVSPVQAARVGYIINLSPDLNTPENESSSSGTVNIKNN